MSTAHKYKYISKGMISAPNGWLTWKNAQNYCQSTFKTDLASFQNATNFGDIFDQFYSRAFIGLRKENKYKSNWIFQDGNDCPMPHTHIDDNGYHLCIDNWRVHNLVYRQMNEPNNLGGKEFCSEINHYGEVNDIECDWNWDPIEGFICNLPDDFDLNALDLPQIGPSKYALNEILYQLPDILLIFGLGYLVVIHFVLIVKMCNQIVIIIFCAILLYLLLIFDKIKYFI